MRIGIFSDVHANIEALSAVMEAYRSEQIDEYYCLGDVVGYGASPNQCADIIRQKAKVTILGNHDAAVADRMDYSFYYDAARHALDWCKSQVSDATIEWLKERPYSQRDGDIEFCHGSPIVLDGLHG